jgi:hypothetical protein
VSARDGATSRKWLSSRGDRVVRDVLDGPLMRKLTRKPLAVAIETLRTLTPNQLATVGGGLFSDVTDECTAGHSACNSRGCVRSVDNVCVKA